MKISKGKVIISFLILFISFSSIIFFENINIFYSNNFSNFLEDLLTRKNKKSNSLIKTDLVIPSNFIKFGNDLSVISGSQYMVLSPSLKKILDINHNFSFPVVKNSKFRSLIFDADGQEYMITTKSKILQKGTLDNKIITGKISERDNLVFLVESDKYCCELIVLSLNGEEKFRYCFAKMFVTDVSINDKGDKVAICGLKSENGTIKSIVQIFDLTSELPIFEQEFENNKFLLINFFNNKDLMAIGDKLTVSIKNLGKKTNCFDYHNKNLCLYSFDKNSGAALSFSSNNDERNQHIVMINKNCKQTANIETNRKLKSISRKRGKILALSESQALVFKLFGKIKYQKKVPINCNKIIPAKNSKFYALGNNEISVMNFK